jgi:hypothetical protein
MLRNKEIFDLVTIYILSYLKSSFVDKFEYVCITDALCHNLWWHDKVASVGRRYRSRLPVQPVTKLDAAWCISYQLFGSSSHSNFDFGFLCLPEGIGLIVDVTGFSGIP